MYEKKKIKGKVNSYIWSTTLSSAKAAEKNNSSERVIEIFYE